MAGREGNKQLATKTKHYEIGRVNRRFLASMFPRRSSSDSTKWPISYYSPYMRNDEGLMKWNMQTHGVSFGFAWPLGAELYF